MSPILPQTKLEAIPPKDVREEAFLVEANALHQMLGFCHKNFSPIAHMALFFGIQVKRPFQKCIPLPPDLRSNLRKTCCDTQILSVPPPPQSKWMCNTNNKFYCKFVTYHFESPTICELISMTVYCYVLVLI